jgi:hypothetical protein
MDNPAQEASVPKEPIQSSPEAAIDDPDMGTPKA